MNLTRNVVAGLIGVGLVWTFFYLLPIQFAIAATALLAFEGWTVANANEYDTISDILRTLARKQLLLPWAFGFTFGVGIAEDYITNIYVVAILALIQGHWFFTFDEQRVEAIKQEVKAEIKEEKQELRDDIMGGRA